MANGRDLQRTLNDLNQSVTKFSEDFKQAGGFKLASEIGLMNNLFERGISLIRDAVDAGDNLMQKAGGLGTTLTNLIRRTGTFSKDLGGSLLNLQANMDILAQGLGSNNKSLREVMVRAKLTDQSDKALLRATEDLITATGMSANSAGDLVKSMVDAALMQGRNMQVTTELITQLKDMTQSLFSIGEMPEAVLQAVNNIVAKAPQAALGNLAKFTEAVVLQTEDLAKYSILGIEGISRQILDLAARWDVPAIEALIIEAINRSANTNRSLVNSWRQDLTKKTIQLQSTYVGKLGQLGMVLQQSLVDPQNTQTNLSQGIFASTQSMTAVMKDIQGQIVNVLSPNSAAIVDLMRAFTSAVIPLIGIYMGGKLLSGVGLGLTRYSKLFRNNPFHGLEGGLGGRLVGGLGRIIGLFSKMALPIAAIGGIAALMKGENIGNILTGIWDTTFGPAFNLFTKKQDDTNLSLEETVAQGKESLGHLKSIDTKTEDKSTKPVLSTSVEAMNRAIDAAFGVKMSSPNNRIYEEMIRTFRETNEKLDEVKSVLHQRLPRSKRGI